MLRKLLLVEVTSLIRRALPEFLDAEKNVSEAEVSKALLSLEELLNFQLVHRDKMFPLNKDKEN